MQRCIYAILLAFACATGPKPSLSVEAFYRASPDALTGAELLDAADRAFAEAYWRREASADVSVEDLAELDRGWIGRWSRARAALESCGGHACPAWIDERDELLSYLRRVR